MFRNAHISERIWQTTGKAVNAFYSYRWLPVLKTTDLGEGGSPYPLLTKFHYRSRKENEGLLAFLKESLENRPTNNCNCTPSARVDWVPVLEHVGDGFEATGCYPPGSSVASVHSPVHQVALVWVQLQQQRDCFTAQLVNLGKDRSNGEGSQEQGVRWGCSMHLVHTITQSSQL